MAVVIPGDVLATIADEEGSSAKLTIGPGILQVLTDDDRLQVCSSSIRAILMS